MKGFALALALALAAPAAQAQTPPANSQTLLGLDPAIIKKLRDAYAPARSPQIDEALRAARQAKLAAIERESFDVIAYLAAAQREKELEANILSRNLDAELNFYASLTPAERKAMVEAERKMSQTLKELRASQR